MCQPGVLLAYAHMELLCWLAEKQLYHLKYVRQIVQLKENTREIPPPLTWSFDAKVPFSKEVATYQDHSRSAIRGNRR